MYKFLGLLILAATLSIFSTAEDVYVEGYTKSNGTYVAPHYRSSPDSSINNNWSTKGNVNPYTGEEGYIPRDMSESGFATGSVPASNLGDSSADNQSAISEDTVLAGSQSNIDKPFLESDFFLTVLGLGIILLFAIFMFNWVVEMFKESKVVFSLLILLIAIITFLILSPLE